MRSVALLPTGCAGTLLLLGVIKARDAKVLYAADAEITTIVKTRKDKEETATNVIHL